MKKQIALLGLILFTATACAAPVYEKQDESVLKVTEAQPDAESVYDYTFLKTQKATLEVELAKVNALIAEADKLGIKEKTEEAANAEAVI